MRKKLNLTQSNLKEIKKTDLNKIRGGCTCGCCGTSSTADNACANADKGLISQCRSQFE